MRVSSTPLHVLGLASLLACWAACGGTKTASISSLDGGGGSSGGSSGGGSGGSSSGGGSGGGSGGSSGSSSSSGGGSGSSSGGNDDAGGCPPCDPGNVNLPGSNCDLDCSGTTTPPGPCDGTLAVGGPATDFAKALGICKVATGGSWGLVSATYTQGYDATTAPNDGQHGLLPKFGSVILPREGTTLGVISSGYALPCDDTSQTATCAASGMGDPYFKGPQTAMDATGSVAPPGYPKGTTECAVAATVFDTIGVTLTIKVPNNVAGMSFDFDFFSSEWPEYVCSTYDDQFVAWLQSEAWAGSGGDLNLAMDSTGNPISVNTPFLNRCTPSTATGCAGTVTGTATCAAGPAELQGTGFYNLGTYCTSQSTGGGATGWLTTTAPVKGGETITLQLILWDTGDANWDSSLLVDNLTWYAASRPVTTAPSQ
jgi:hypothetical protein